MDMESFVRDLLSDPQSAIKAYREGGERDDAIEELIKQATHLEKGIADALALPVPSGLAASVLTHVQGLERERLAFEQDLLSDPQSAIKAYREGGERNDAIEELIEQATDLEKGLTSALALPVPTGLAAGILKNVQDSERERLVFERALMTEPEQALADMAESKAADEDRQALAEEARQFENTLQAAVNVTPPANLAQSLTDHVQRSASDRRPRAWITGIAASVFALIGVALILAPRQGEAAKLQAAFSEHAVHEEPGAMTNFLPVDEQMVAALFSDFGAQRTQSFGPVHYARKCPIGEGRGAHLVMQRDDGPVTFLFLPNESLASAQSFEVDGGITGRMFPLANGVGALFGHAGQSLDGLDQEITRSFSQAVASTAHSQSADQG